MTWIIVGGIAGVPASFLVRGGSFGPPADILVGVIGSLIVAFIGAVILLLIVRLVTGRRATRAAISRRAARRPGGRDVSHVATPRRLRPVIGWVLSSG